MTGHQPSHKLITKRKTMKDGGSPAGCLFYVFYESEQMESVFCVTIVCSLEGQNLLFTDILYRIKFRKKVALKYRPIYCIQHKERCTY